MAKGPVGGAVTHGLCLDCLPDLVGTPVEDLAQAGDDALERLPYGVIRLDAQDRVAAYSMDESRRSRLPREQVLGRPFFTEIAPCTNVRELAGWVAKARAARVPARKRLEFVFRFSHGRELVDVALAYDPRDGVVLVLVQGIEEGASP